MITASTASNSSGVRLVSALHGGGKHRSAHTGQLHGRHWLQAAVTPAPRHHLGPQRSGRVTMPLVPCAGCTRRVLVQGTENICTGISASPLTRVSSFCLDAQPVRALSYLYAFGRGVFSLVLWTANITVL
jgi:hypothetical protein